MSAESEMQSEVNKLIDRFSNRSLPVQNKGVECSLNCFNQGQDYKEVNYLRCYTVIS